MNTLFTLSTALVLGAAGSFHCVVMCGGIATAIDSGGRASRFTGYHLGRLISYISAGIAAGALGQAHHVVPMASAQGWLRVAAGLLMAVLGLHLLGLVSGITAIERAGKPLWNRIAPTLRELLPARSVPHAVLVGALWGWMPCGLVYSALVQALASGSAVMGGLVMAAFGLATVPALGLVALMGHRAQIAARTAPRLRMLAGALMLTWGVISLSVGIPMPGSSAPPCHDSHSAHAR